MTTTIRFEFTDFKEKTHRFSYHLPSEGLFETMKMTVCEILGVEDQKMFWAHDFTLAPLNCADDLAAAIDRAEAAVKSRGGNPSFWKRTPEVIIILPGQHVSKGLNDPQLLEVSSAEACKEQDPINEARVSKGFAENVEMKTSFSKFLLVNELEKAYAVVKYPRLDQREAMAARLGLSKERIQTWFENRRAKSRNEDWICELNQLGTRTMPVFGLPWTDTLPSDNTIEDDRREYENMNRAVRMMLSGPEQGPNIQFVTAEDAKNTSLPNHEDDASAKSTQEMTESNFKKMLTEMWADLKLREKDVERREEEVTNREKMVDEKVARLEGSIEEIKRTVIAVIREEMGTSNAEVMEKIGQLEKRFTMMKMDNEVTRNSPDFDMENIPKRKKSSAAKEEEKLMQAMESSERLWVKMRRDASSNKNKKSTKKRHTKIDDYIEDTGTDFNLQNEENDVQAENAVEKTSKDERQLTGSPIDAEILEEFVDFLTCEPCAFADYDEPIDYAALLEKTIEELMKESQVNRETAIRALRAADFDICEAIIMSFDASYDVTANMDLSLFPYSEDVLEITKLDVEVVMSQAYVGKEEALRALKDNYHVITEAIESLKFGSLPNVPMSRYGKKMRNKFGNMSRKAGKKAAKKAESEAKKFISSLCTMQTDDGAPVTADATAVAELMNSSLSDSSDGDYEELTLDSIATEVNDVEMFRAAMDAAISESVPSEKHRRSASAGDETDIELVMSQANVSRNEAISALRAADNDIVNAIMSFDM